MLVVNQTHKFATKRIITINEIFIELRTSGNVIHSVRNERRYGFFVFLSHIHKCVVWVYTLYLIKFSVP